MRDRPRSFERASEAEERGAILPETAVGLATGDVSAGEHFQHYECQAAVEGCDGKVRSEHEHHALRAFPECEMSRLHFMAGWRHAANGYERITLYESDGTKLVRDPAKLLGWDTYQRVKGPVWWRKSRRERI